MDALEIRKKRKALGYTQKEFAALVGVSGNTIINWEKGENIPASKYPILDSVLNKPTKTYKMKSTIDEVNEPKSELPDKNGVPYYDLEFTASFFEVDNNQSTIPSSYISHPFFKGCDYVVRASGQSMAKLICHGDAIGLIKVENWRQFFPFGEIYAIVTNDGFRMIKVVTAGENNETFTLISKPTDSKKDEFPPQQIKIDSILHLFKVQASSHLF